MQGIIRPQALRKQGLWLPFIKCLGMGQLNPGINLLIKYRGVFSLGDNNPVKIKYAKNIDAADYVGITKAVQELFRILKPHEADTVDDLPVLKCEMDVLYVSAGARQLKLNRKINSLKQQLDENNETQEIQKALLEAEESGGLNKKSQNKIQAILKKPAYQKLPDEERKEIIENLISGKTTEPVDKILTFANLKHDPSPKSIEKCIAIILELSENLSSKLDALDPGILSDKQTEKLIQELKQLEIKVSRFTNHNIDGSTK